MVTSVAPKQPLLSRASNTELSSGQFLINPKVDASCDALAFTLQFGQQRIGHLLAQLRPLAVNSRSQHLERKFCARARRRACPNVSTSSRSMNVEGRFPERNDVVALRRVDSKRLAWARALASNTPHTLHVRLRFSASGRQMRLPRPVEQLQNACWLFVPGSPPTTAPVFMQPPRRPMDFPLPSCRPVEGMPDRLKSSA